jgi:solute carrier family 25 thiamine pyrophosphate transporter 19
MTESSTLTSSAAAGSIAGAVTRLVTAPLDVIKIRFQLQMRNNPRYKYVSDAVRSIAREEGILALWRGNLCATYLWVSYGMVQFLSYDILKASIKPVVKKTYNESIATFAIASVSSAAAVTISYPFDLLRTQFVVQGQQVLYPSIVSFVSKVHKTQGVMGFFSGLSTALLGVVPTMGLNFVIYESLVRRMNEYKSKMMFDTSTKTDHAQSSGRDGSSRGVLDARNKLYSSISSVLLTNGVCGGISGGVSKLTVYPLDTAKKYLQLQVVECSYQRSSSGKSFALAGDGAAVNNLRNCLQLIYKQEGFYGFYKGMVPSVMKSALSSGIMFATYEGCKFVLDSVGAFQSATRIL